MKIFKSPDLKAKKPFNAGDYDILASCYGDPEHGRFGLVRIRNGRAEVVDGLSSTGLAVSGGRIYRLMRHRPYITGRVQELVVYESGKNGKTDVLSLVYHGIADPHDVFVNKGVIYVVSAGTNEIARLNEKTYKEEAERIKFGGSGNAWHINCLGIIGGRLCVSAFNECEDDFGWRNFPTKGAGFVMDVETGKKIWEGLSMPHNPVQWNGITAVCDSETGSVLLRGKDGSVKEVSFGGFTRGLAFSGGYMFAGVSAGRKSRDNAEGGEENARICVYDIAAGEIIHEIALPFPELYSVILIGGKDFSGEIPAVSDLFREKDAEIEKLKSSLSDARGTSLIEEQEPLDAPGGPFYETETEAEAEGRGERVRLRILKAEIPETMNPASEHELAVTVENRTGVTMQSIEPYPVYLSYHWKKADEESGLYAGGVYCEFEGIRTPFNAPLFPFSRMKAAVGIKAPSVKGRYVLEITMVQERRFWFESRCANLPVRFHVTVE